MIISPLVTDAGLTRRMYPGDVLTGGELISQLATVGNGTLTAQLITSGVVNRTGSTGAFTDTTDTGGSIIGAMIGNYSYNASATAGLPSGNAVQIGTTFRFRYINSVAFPVTLAAGSVSVTLGVNTGIAASSVKEFLVTVVNGTPPQVFAVTTTNGSAVVTGLTLFQTSTLSVGMIVVGGNVSGTIISIQPGVGVTLSAAATATGTLASTYFHPSVRIDSLGQYLL